MNANATVASESSAPEYAAPISEPEGPTSSSAPNESDARAEFEKAKALLAELQKRLANPMADPSFAASVVLLKEAREHFQRKNFTACVETSRQIRSG